MKQLAVVEQLSVLTKAVKEWATVGTSARGYWPRGDGQRVAPEERGQPPRRRCKEPLVRWVGPLVAPDALIAFEAEVLLREQLVSRGSFRHASMIAELPRGSASRCS